MKNRLIVKPSCFIITIFLTTITTYLHAADARYQLVSSEPNDQIVFFAGKGDRSLLACNTITQDDKTLIFYGLCTSHAQITDHIAQHITTKIASHASAKIHKLSDVITNAMSETLQEFYQTYPEADPLDPQYQDIFISFVRIHKEKIHMYHCFCDNGTFKILNGKPIYCTLNPETKENNVFVPLAIEQHEGFKSDTYEQIVHNAASRTALLKTPQKLAQRIMNDDQDKTIKAMLLIKGNEWLIKRNHPTLSPLYQQLKEKWDNKADVIISRNKIETEILKHRHDTIEKLQKLKKDLPKKFSEEDDKTMRIYIAFLDDIIKKGSVCQEKRIYIPAYVGNTLFLLFKIKKITINILNYLQQ